MNTPVEVLLAVAGIGGKLGIAEGGSLRTLLPADCPPGLKDAIREQKPALLGLLALNFLIVRSAAFNATLFWTPDEATKEALIAVGADPGVIYTAAELAALVNHRVTTGELPAIHAAKRQFAGRITQSNGRPSNRTP